MAYNYRRYFLENAYNVQPTPTCYLDYSEMSYQLDSVWLVEILDSSGFISGVRFLSVGRWYAVVTTKIDTYSLLSWVLLPPVQLSTNTTNDLRARRNVIHFIIQDGSKLLWGVSVYRPRRPDSNLEAIANYVSNVDFDVDRTYGPLSLKPKMSVSGICLQEHCFFFRKTSKLCTNHGFKLFAQPLVRLNVAALCCF